MRSFNRQNIRNWTLTGLTLLTPVMVYGASALVTFQPHTPIKSEEVNANFAQLDGRIGVYEDACVVGGNGNVGVGTVGTNEKLTLPSGGMLGFEYASTGSGVYHTIGLNGSDGIGSPLQFKSKYTSILTNRAFSFFGTPGGKETELLTILNDGKVGIGTTSPISTLHISTPNDNTNIRLDSSGGHGARIDFNDSLNNVTTRIGHLNDIGVFQIGVGDASPAVTVDGSGNVGINTSSPDAKLEISRFAGTPYLHGDSSSDLFDIIVTDTASMALGYSDPGTAKLAVNGNVGIGRTNPAYSLDVSGPIRVESTVISSDARLKRDIRPLTHALEGIQCLQGVSYYLRDSEADQGLQLGLIAQEVERCYPELVSTDPEGFKSVSYDRLVAPLIEAVKTQQQLIERQQQTLQAQQQTLQAQQQTLQTQQQTLQAQQQALQTQQQLSARLEARLARIERTLGNRP